MDVSVLQQVGYQHGGQRLVYLHPERSLLPNVERDVPVAVDLPVVVNVSVQYVVEADGGGVGKLAVVYLGEQQERFVQLGGVVQRLKRLQQLSHLRLGEGFVLHQHLYPVLADGQRGLHLVRGVPDELLLLFEQLFAACRVAQGRFVQFPEFGNVGRVAERRVLPAQPVIVQPMEEDVEGLQALPEHPHVDEYNGEQQGDVQADDEVEHGTPQVFLLNGGGGDGQLVTGPLFVSEQRRKDTGRFPLFLLRYVNHAVPVTDVFVLAEVRLVHLRQEILVVRPAVLGRQLLPRQRTDDDKLRVVLQAVVHLVVYFVDDGGVEEHGPCRKNQDDADGKAEEYMVEQFHGRMRFIRQSVCSRSRIRP